MKYYPFLRFSKMLSWFLTNLVGIVFILSQPSLARSPDDLEQFSGAHTRIVWIQQQGGGADTYGFGNNFKLMGLDSRDGKGERPLLKEIGNFYKPLLTPDGKGVVVSSRTRHETYLVDFKKGSKKKLGQGVAVAVWQDPAVDKVWVYALAGSGAEDKYLSTNPLVRYPLNKPSKREVVWNKTPMSWSNFNISRDGKFAGGLFPWPNAGIFITEQGIWKKYGKGCWTALSPDNSAVLWVFDGLHRNLNFVNPFTARFWTTNINNAPGINGYEVYHPRWSNHVRYLTMTGPYVEGEGGNKINGGGAKVEIYLGRFSPDLTAVEEWLQVSKNKKADFYPDVWISNGKTSALGQSSRTKPKSEGVAISGEWPVENKSTVFLWQDMLSDNQLKDNSPVGFKQIDVAPVGRARYNRYLEMDFNGDGFVSKTDQQGIIQSLRQNDAFVLEFLYTPTEAGSKTRGSLFRYTGKDADNIELVQKGRDLQVKLLRKKKKRTMTSVTVPVRFVEKQPVYLAVQYTKTELEVFVNGRSAIKKAVNAQPVAGWQDGIFHFGNTRNNRADALLGAISHVTVLAQPRSTNQIIQNAQLVTGSLEKRKTLSPLLLKGKLIETSAIPAPDNLGAYSRALVVNRYTVLAIEKGNYQEKEILVASWAVLDRKILPEAKKRTTGKTEILKVEPFDQHPELEGERLMMDMFEPDLELYYSVHS